HRRLPRVAVSPDGPAAAGPARACPVSALVSALGRRCVGRGPRIGRVVGRSLLRAVDRRVGQQGLVVRASQGVALGLADVQPPLAAAVVVAPAVPLARHVAGGLARALVDGVAALLGVGIGRGGGRRLAARGRARGGLVLAAARQEQGGGRECEGTGAVALHGSTVLGPWARGAAAWSHRPRPQGCSATQRDGSPPVAGGPTRSGGGRGMLWARDASAPAARPRR